VLVKNLLRAAFGVSVLLASARFAGATEFASQVVSYTPGAASTTDPTFVDPSAALGAPSGITGVLAGFPNVLSPFSPAFDVGQIVVIGEGGELTLKFPSPISTAPGLAIGVISNSGLIDNNYPSGQATNPATNFGGGSADVSVSQDGKTFVSLGEKEFLNPANFYLNAGPYDTTAPTSPQLADFGKAFAGDLNAFNNEDDAQVVSTLNGSGGGTWLDLSASGLSQVNFIEFSVPTDGTSFGGTVGSRLPIDAVAVADDHLFSQPQPIPLPPEILSGLVGLGVVVAIRSFSGRGAKEK
jgi:hypothetical protein